MPKHLFDRCVKREESAIRVCFQETSDVGLGYARDVSLHKRRVKRNGMTTTSRGATIDAPTTPDVQMRMIYPGNVAAGILQRFGR